MKFAIFDIFDAITYLAQSPTVFSAEAATQDSGSVLDHILFLPGQMVPVKRSEHEICEVLKLIALALDAPGLRRRGAANKLAPSM